MSDQIRFTLRDGMDLAGIDLKALWWRYVAVGGSCDPLELADELLGVRPCGQYEHDAIAQALNEAFIDQGTDTFPVAYSGSLAPFLAGRLGPAAERSPLSGVSPAQARRDAAAARLRSAAAARRAAALHAQAAQLMQASGQLQFARHARARSRRAQQRATVQTAA